jgi:serine/threonine-protein kinase PpkA
MKRIFFLWVVSLCLMAGLCSQAAAGDFEDLKRSVFLRADAIRTLKSQGLLREGAKGQLVPVGQLSASQQRLLDEENSDRSRLFTLIGDKSGMSLSEVVAAFQKMAGSGYSSPSPVPPVNPSLTTPVPSPIRPEPSRALPTKVITKPFSTIRRSAELRSPAVRESVPAFSIFYVFQKADGWFQVGEREDGVPLGWLSPEDAIEWKQNLVVKFTHSDGRKPVLFFKDRSELEKIALEPRSRREAEMQSLLSKIAGGSIPDGFPVVAKEPEGMVDARERFYMLPILDFQSMDFDGREGRLLQVSALTRKRSSESPFPITEDFTGTADLKVDIVFVMDLSRSMGPFALKTLAMIQNTASLLSKDPATAGALRFGFWGYRDSPEKAPGIGFNTKNFTPTLQTAEDFARTLATAEETKVDSIDYEEDVFAGVADAIEGKNWRPDAIRLLVLVGDAPGRAPGEIGRGFPNGPKGTASRMDANGIRNLANSSKVYVSTLYLNAPKWSSYTEKGEEQFRALGRNPNSLGGRENFALIDASNPAIYGETAVYLSKGILQAIADAREGKVAGGGDDDSSADPVTDFEGARKKGLSLASNMFRGAMMEWLGSRQGAEAPADVTGWVSDKDLQNPVRQALDVQVFLTKNQLNDLKIVLDLVVNAGLQGKVSGKDFFDSLRAVVAAAARDPGQIAKAESLIQTGLVPLFLKDLPYQSAVMGMSNESWGQMPPDAQERFLNDVLAKIRYYQVIHDNPEHWVALTEGDSPDDYVAAIPLEQLP